MPRHVSNVLAIVAIAIAGTAIYLQLRSDRIIHARGVIISDANGVERIVLGAPTPGPVIDGKHQSRAGDLSGIVINGPDGNERGGYGTIDVGGEAVLTLDSQDGRTEQLKIVSNPKDGASLFLANGDGSKTLMLSTYTGQPRITLLYNDKEVAFYSPTVAPAASGE